jgi:branched-chain amino acid aminotransferase
MHRRPQPPLKTVDWDSLGFGLTKVDYMFLSRTVKGTPFSKGELVPYGPLSLEPAATVLNYGQGLFEGIKGTLFCFTMIKSDAYPAPAFRTAKDRIVVFRPIENSRRMNKGASKFLMPSIQEDLFLRGIDEVVQSNSQWVPPLDRYSLISLKEKSTY